jgi:hypothetical protein
MNSMFFANKTAGWSMQNSSLTIGCLPLPKMLRLAALVTLFVTIAPAPALAQASLATTVGGASLLMPVPQGYIEPSQSAPCYAGTRRQSLRLTCGCWLCL